MLVFTIDGVDLAPYIQPDGFKWNSGDVEITGTTLDGETRRKRIKSKITLEVTCKPLRTPEARTVLMAIAPEWVDVTYTDPREGGVVTKRMYSNNAPATNLIDDLWHGIAFQLYE